MKRFIQYSIFIIFSLLFTGCGFYDILDYTDENNESYITLIKEEGCRVYIKYLGTYPSYPDLHGQRFSKEMIIHEQTYLLIKGPSTKENEPSSKIIDCHVELKDDQNNIIPYIHIEVIPVEKIDQDSLIYKDEKDHLKSKSNITSNIHFYEIFYLYNDTSQYKTVSFYLKLTLSLKGKLRIIEKKALLKRKEGKVFFSPFGKIRYW
jgi:hypothetical protein